MTNAEIERRIQHFRVRKGRLSRAIQDGAVRVPGRRAAAREQCDMCKRREGGGGLVCYRLRDGQDLIVGDRCAMYIDYLTKNPTRARVILQ